MALTKGYNRMMGDMIDLCQGRLTLTTAVPITTSDVAGATSIYFTPYNGSLISLYDGSTAWQTYSFTELTRAVGTLTSGKNYDLFVWNNSGTITLSIGTAWTSDTARVSGSAGEIVVQNGIYVNKYADGSVPALQGRYVGTFRTTATTTTEDSLTKRLLWNMYNRAHRKMAANETATSWTYGTASWRYLNNNSSNRLEVLNGILGESFVDAKASALASNVTNVITHVGIGEDSSTTSIHDTIGRWTSNAVGQCEHIASVNRYVPLGWHYYAAIEFAEAGTGQYYSSGTSSTYPAGIYARYMS